jgi:hypothetical protein
MAGEDDQGGQWLNLTEAAHRLGWSRERLRSHARRGRLRTMRGNSGELLVLVTADLTGVAAARSDQGGQTGVVKHGRTRAARGGQTEPDRTEEITALKVALARAEGELAATNRLVDELKRELEWHKRPWWRRWLEG